VRHVSVVNRHHSLAPRNRAIAVLAAGITALLLLWLLRERLPGGESRGAVTPPVSSSTASGVPSSIGPSVSPLMPAGSPPAAVSALPDLAPTQSADVYAAEIAKAIYGVDYTRQSRAHIVAFWQGELARALPQGVPAGTTLVQAQDDGMATLAAYVPTDAVWATLAKDHTSSSFRVTAVSEPPSWVAGVTSGKIVDPGLTARTVLGVQTLRYGSDPNHLYTATLSRELTVVMLCPPTISSCKVEVFPPRDNAAGRP
jgi:hypothetical protein